MQGERRHRVLVATGAIRISGPSTSTSRFACRCVRPCSIVVLTPGVGIGVGRGAVSLCALAPPSGVPSLATSEWGLAVGGVVLVHGNPETSAVWDPLLAALDHDEVTCLSPPGFGAPVPDGWGATAEEYRDWLIAELEALGPPVDLVGHDWGGGHAVAVAMVRPDLLRSWCTDVIGVFDPEYVWHELARAWQTPGTGEQLVAAWAAETVQERAARLVSLGVTEEVAERLAAGYDETMGRCILALYRSAAQPRLAQLGEGLGAAARRPGLHLSATEDHFAGTEEMQRRAADRCGARVEVLDGLGHWWMVQDPARGAAALTRFWTSVPA
jgi:pimeloyl-ACP methyl ester carboxylesterase